MSAGSFGDVLPNQADGVLAGGALVWAAGVSKVDIALECGHDCFVLSKLSAVVEGDRVHFLGAQALDGGSGDVI